LGKATLTENGKEARYQECSRGKAYTINGRALSLRSPALSCGGLQPDAPFRPAAQFTRYEQKYKKILTSINQGSGLV
jgi:hypothetical protein